jgi:hypothetical protein
MSDRVAGLVGQYASLGGSIVKQHVNANGPRWVQAFHHGHGGDIKA